MVLHVAILDGHSRCLRRLWRDYLEQRTKVLVHKICTIWRNLVQRKNPQRKNPDVNKSRACGSIITQNKSFIAGT